jgi:hypothetical protein
MTDRLPHGQRVAVGERDVASAEASQVAWFELRHGTEGYNTTRGNANNVSTRPTSVPR